MITLSKIKTILMNISQMLRPLFIDKYLNNILILIINIISHLNISYPWRLDIN